MRLVASYGSTYHTSFDAANQALEEHEQEPPETGSGPRGAFLAGRTVIILIRKARTIDGWGSGIGCLGFSTINILLLLGPTRDQVNLPFEVTASHRCRGGVQCLSITEREL